MAGCRANTPPTSGAVANVCLGRYIDDDINMVAFGTALEIETGFMYLIGGCTDQSTGAGTASCQYRWTSDCIRAATVPEEKKKKHGKETH